MTSQNDDGLHAGRFAGLRLFRRKGKKSTESLPSERAEPKISQPMSDPEANVEVKAILDGEGTTHRSGTAEFEEFLDERMLVSRDALGKKEMKIKILEISDEYAPSKWKLGDRVKARKILVTIKHLDTTRVEESEFDIEAIEAELADKRHYTSSNRWVPATDIRNGYVLKTRHMSLISDAIALDYISF